MATVLVITSVFLVYFFRDTQLLTSGPRNHHRTRLAAYGVAQVIYVGVLCVLTRTIDPSRVPSLLRSPAVWVPSLTLHVILALASVWTRRRNTSEGVRLAALAPAPIFLLSIMVLGCWVSARTHGLSMPLAALVFTMMWLSMIIVSALWVSNLSVGERDVGFAIDFDAVTNASLVLVAPINLLLGNLSASL